jgi:TRAP-type C4-dicarboxylate transport system permease small subunit
VLQVDEVSVSTAGILARVIGVGLGLLALVLSLLAWSSERRGESRALGLGVAVALLAGAVWSAYREDRWWMLAAGLIAAVLWIVFEEWRGRRKSRQAAEVNSNAAG